MPPWYGRSVSQPVKVGVNSKTKPVQAKSISRPKMLQAKHVSIFNSICSLAPALFILETISHLIGWNLSTLEVLHTAHRYVVNHLYKAETKKHMCSRCSQVLEI